jgi:hypothetical protein
MNKILKISIAMVLLLTASLGWAEVTIKTIEVAKFEVVFIEGNQRGRLIVRDMECDPECSPIIMIMGRGVPIFKNIVEPVSLDTFIKMKRGQADVQYDTATNQVIKVRLQ